MAGSLNKVMLIGNVGSDPEIRSFPSGGKVANFSLATSETWKDRNTGEKQERTEWHRIAIFNEGLIGVVESYVKKGAKLFVEGQVKTRKWQDQSGADRYSTEIVLQGPNGRLILLGDPSGSGSGSGSRGSGSGSRGSGSGSRGSGSGSSGGGWDQGGGSSGGGYGGSGYGGDYDDLDDDIPF
jgi:single-strand DNA-binding protein